MAFELINCYGWRAGTAGKLKVQLIDTAANSSKNQQLATAEVKLDMRQWKDSQTYQAQIALETDQVHLPLLSLLRLPSTSPSLSVSVVQMCTC